MNNCCLWTASSRSKKMSNFEVRRISGRTLKLQVPSRRGMNFVGLYRDTMFCNCQSGSASKKGNPLRMRRRHRGNRQWLSGVRHSSKRLRFRVETDGWAYLQAELFSGKIASISWVTAGVLPRTGARKFESSPDALSDRLIWARDPNRKQQRMACRGSLDKKSRDKMATSTQNLLVA